MKILLIGGSGYMGSAVLTSRPWDGDYVVLSRDENKQERLRRRFSDVRTILGDIRDRDRLDPLMIGMDLVIHMAALKHIDEAEFNVSETISVNIVGTENVLRAAALAGVPSVVFISTDKATAPLNSYGSTKQLGERLVGEYARKWTNTRFTATRFGNVVGSTGSVTWKWWHSIAESGTVTLTDPAMTRFWMAPSEAVAAIEAATRIPSGGILIPRCAAASVGAVAEAMGAKRVDRIGLRPGERMDEMLVSREEWPRVLDLKVPGRWGTGLHLRPAYEAGRPGALHEYRSSAAVHTLDAGEIRAMVEEARPLW